MAAQRDARAPPPPESVMLEDPAAPAAHPPALLFADVRADLLEPAFDTGGLEEPTAADAQQEAACPPLVSGGGGASSHVPGLPAALVAPSRCGWGHGDMGGEAVVPPALVRGPAPHLRPAAPCTSLASLPRVCARPCVVRRRGWVVCRACPACWCTIRRGNRRVWVCMGQLLCLASAVLLCVRGVCACELCDFWWLERIYA